LNWVVSGDLTCTEVTCPAIVVLASDGVVLLGDACNGPATQGQTCAVQCGPGLTGAAVQRTCNIGDRAGVWTTEEPNCVALPTVCPALAIETNFYTASSGCVGGYRSGSCQVGCGGYTTGNQVTINCINGAWDYPQFRPTCVAAKCSKITAGKRWSVAGNCGGTSGDVCTITCAADSYKTYSRTCAKGAWSGQDMGAFCPPVKKCKDTTCPPVYPNACRQQKCQDSDDGPVCIPVPAQPKPKGKGNSNAPATPPAGYDDYQGWNNDFNSYKWMPDSTDCGGGKICLKGKCKDKPFWYQFAYGMSAAVALVGVGGGIFAYRKRQQRKRGEAAKSQSESNTENSATQQSQDTNTTTPSKKPSNSPPASVRIRVGTPNKRTPGPSPRNDGPVLSPQAPRSKGNSPRVSTSPRQAVDNQGEI